MKNRTGNRGGRGGGCLNTRTGTTGQSHRHGSSMATSMLRIYVTCREAQAGFSVAVADIPSRVTSVEQTIQRLGSTEDAARGVKDTLAITLLCNRHMDARSRWDQTVTSLALWLLMNGPHWPLVASGAYARCWIELVLPEPQQHDIQLRFHGEPADPSGASENTVH